MSDRQGFVREATFQCIEFLREIAVEALASGYTIPELIDLLTDIWAVLEERLARGQEPFITLERS